MTCIFSITLRPHNRISNATLQFNMLQYLLMSMKHDPYILIMLINIFEYQSLFCNPGFTGVIGFYYFVHINNYGKIAARKSNTKVCICFTVTCLYKTTRVKQETPQKNNN